MTAALESVAGLALVALPWLVLMWAAWTVTRRRRRPDAREVRSEGRADVQSVMMTLKDETPEVASPAADVTAVPAPAAPRSPEDALLDTLAAAEARGDMQQLTRDGLSLAQLLIARGARVEAKALLTKTAMVATRSKLALENASARIELAELARFEGDMTTACEHWQLAKQLYHELDRKADAEKMGDNLRLNRCPTDWFLTGF